MVTSAQINQAKHYYAECLIKEEMEEKGWELTRFFQRYKDKKGNYRMLFNAEETSKFLEGNKKGITNFDFFEISRRGYKLPDFLCRRKGFIKCVEIKTTDRPEDNPLHPEETPQGETAKVIWDELGIMTEMKIFGFKAKDCSEEFVLDMLKDRYEKEGSIEYDGDLSKPKNPIKQS